MSINMKTATPVMRQFWEAKKKYPDSILLFRMGDFYETFDDDAKLASQILGITLTKRANGAASSVPLAGFPFHSLEQHLHKLLNDGHRVAICEQVEDPKKSKGIVKREVVEVLSPGTAISDRFLIGNENNFLGCVVFNQQLVGIAFIDYSTGEFFCGEWKPNQVNSIIDRYALNEILISESQIEEIKPYIYNKNILLTTIADFLIDSDSSYDILKNHFNTKSMKGFGLEGMSLAISASGAAFDYIKNNYLGSMDHITTLNKIVDSEILSLDSFTIRNLEIFHSLSGLEKGTLISVIDKTSTLMGSRKLKSWIKRPLNCKSQIIKRQKKIAEYYDNDVIRNDTIDVLKQVSDIDRIVARLSTNKSNPRDLLSLFLSLDSIEQFKKITPSTLKNISELLINTHDLTGLCKQIDKTIEIDCPANFNNSGYIKNGFSKELDALRSISANANDWLVKMQVSEQERTAIPSLKVGFNKVFGYYIEVTKTHLDKIPEDYIRKQTLTNAERFFTEELKEYEVKILSSEQKIQELEMDIFNQLRKDILDKALLIQQNAEIISDIDVFSSLAELALLNNYSCPKISKESKISLNNSRHPVVERLLPMDEDFIPNSIELDNNNQIAIITGPNMAGKSTYLRQIALNVILAQIGSYIPASKSNIGLVDKLFTRVGSSDNLVGGESTFLVEMNETANILNNATGKSLVILDEVGRGTSTYDGLSIAWAITEYIHNDKKVVPKTLFATHYHELIDLADRLPKAFNLNISVKETDDKIVFLRKIVQGGASKSYGIHVAEMSGIPNEVIYRSHQLLKKLMQDKAIENLDINNEDQLQIFDKKEQEFIKEIKSININNITPLEALQILSELKNKYS